MIEAEVSIEKFVDSKIIVRINKIKSQFVK